MKTALVVKCTGEVTCTALAGKITGAILMGGNKTNLQSLITLHKRSWKILT